MELIRRMTVATKIPDNISARHLMIVLQRTNSTSIQQPSPEDGRGRSLNHRHSGNMTGGNVLL